MNVAVICPGGSQRGRVARGRRALWWVRDGAAQCSAPQPATKKPRSAGPQTPQSHSGLSSHLVLDLAGVGLHPAQQRRYQVVRPLPGPPHRLPAALGAGGAARRRRLLAAGAGRRCSWGGLRCQVLWQAHPQARQQHLSCQCGQQRCIALQDGSMHASQAGAPAAAAEAGGVQRGSRGIAAQAAAPFPCVPGCRCRRRAGRRRRWAGVR